MKIFNLLETKYNLLVNKFKTYLAKELPSTFGGTYGNNTIFGQLITVLSASIQNVMLYIEDSLIEQNKYTAQRKRSIYGLAAQSGYQPFLGKAAGVQLKLSYLPNNADNMNVIINNHTQLTCTQNGLVYNLILPQEAIFLTPDKDISSKYLYAVQGRFETQTFTSTGGMYYTQNLVFQGNLDTDYLEVYINNEKWEYVPSIYDMNPDGKQWTYQISINNGIELIFGNKMYGCPLQDKDQIRVSYLIHDGEMGNIDVNKETYFVFSQLINDTSGNQIDGNSLLNITFATKDAVTSGSNSEPVSLVKKMIGYNSRSLVLSSAEHYKNFINKFSFCGYNRTWSEPGELMVNSLIMKNYKLRLNQGSDYFNLTENDFILSETQKKSIKNCIENSGIQIAGSIYNILNPKLCKYALYVHVKLKQANYNKEFITNQIRTIVGDFFSNVQSDIYIPKSDIIYAIKQQISEIDGLEIYFLSERNETAQIRGEYENEVKVYNNKTYRYDIKTETVPVFPGENPNLGLDDHGNILLLNDNYFPVLMGHWSFKLSDQQLNYAGQLTTDQDTIEITDPLIIIYE